MLEVRTPSLTSSKVSKRGCVGPAFPGEAHHSLRELLHQAQEVREVPGLLQEGLHGAPRSWRSGALRCLHRCPRQSCAQGLPPLL